MKVDQTLLDRFDHLIKHPYVFSEGKVDFLHHFRRTPNAWRSEVKDISTGKFIAGGYIFDLREQHGKLVARMGRLLVNEAYRGLGFGSRVFDERVRVFGPTVELHLSAHPNRSSDLTPENFEEKLQMLINMYSRRGFILKEGSKSGMYRPIGELTYVSPTY
jgi:GNAT superfamily N-acetyltransferase